MRDERERKRGERERDVNLNDEKGRRVRWI